VVTGATSYTVQVSTSATFTPLVVNQSGVTTTSRAVSGLKNNTTYYWRVRASNAGGAGAWSVVRSFTTGGAVAVPGVPVLVSPVDRATGVALTPTLSWRAVTGATSYTVQVATSATFTPLVVNQSGVTGTSRAVSGLENNTTYYWRVRASNAGGAGAWSVVRSFTTGNAPATAVTRTLSGQLTTSSSRFSDGRYFARHSVTLVTGQKLSLRMTSTTAISFEGLWDERDGQYIDGNPGSFRQLDDFSIPHDGLYSLYVSGDRVGVTGAYTFTVTATPGPLDIGPASKPVVVEAGKGKEGTKIAGRFSLTANFPNPFNGVTTLGYEIREAAEVRVVVYDLGGRQVRVLVEEYQQAGRYEVVWDGRDAEGREVASGIYFYRLETAEWGFVETKRMLLAR
jgi:hypothetical protein